MGHTRQVEGWLEELGRFREHTAWKTLSKDALHLDENFASGLQSMPADSHANVVGPFAAAVISLWEKRGVDVYETPLTRRDTFGTTAGETSVALPV